MEIEEFERRANICSENYSGIVPTVEAFYLHSIICSAARCLDSFSRYDYLKSREASADDLVSLVQEAIGHSAALSRYFWPSPIGKKKQPNQKTMKKKRGEKLCKAFQLDESSALYNRDLRNAWEHFDEKLDSYLLEQEAGAFFPSCMINAHHLADEQGGHIFKLLDTEEECLVLLGVKYFFIPIHEEVKKVLELAIKADKMGQGYRRYKTR